MRGKYIECITYYYSYTGNSPSTYNDVFGFKRNIVVDFLFGGCLDLPKNWKCAENGWEKAGAVGLCALDAAGFIPGAGAVAKGAKGAAVAGKAAKAAKAADKAAKAAKAAEEAAKAAKAAQKGLKGERGYRYMGKGELDAIMNANKDSRYLRGGWEGETYYTKDLYKSASKAQERLALPETPSYRMEFEIINNPKAELYGHKVDPVLSRGQLGKGSEFMTNDKVQIRVINVQPIN